MEKDSFEEYEAFKEKYNLPPIEELAKDFDIEKIDDEEYFFILKRVRKIINEKISSYLQLFESIINPSSAPLFIYSLLREFDSSTKEQSKEIYKKLAKINLKVLKLDCSYDEKAEAEFIKQTFLEWQNLKKQIFEISSKIYKAMEDNKPNNSSNYFY